AIDVYADEEESLQFPDLINRGIEVAAQRRDFNLLVCSVDTGDHDYSRRIFALARKSDGPIPHDQGLRPDPLARPARQSPTVTLAGVQTLTTTNVGGDNVAGMRELARHLVHDHGFRTLAYLSGHAGSPDDIARHATFGAEVTASGASFADGPQWRGNCYAAGGARGLRRAPGGGAPPPPAPAGPAGPTPPRGR